ncbi:MAG: site-2 protease family protein [Verrucomicrobiota bacterium]
MKWSVPLGRVAGIPIRMHASFILLLAWIAWEGWKINGLSSSLWALALINCLFACVVLHELGHSLVAVHFGAEVRSVTLLPIGGVASMKSIPEKPHQEFLVSLAGPLVNVLIACVLAAVRGGFPSWAVADGFPTSLGGLVDSLVRANIVLASFNLLPAFPMDGGRVLRSLLALFLPHARATAISATMGQVLAIGFILVGLLLNPVLVLIGVFVFIAAESEERSVHVRHLLRDVLVEDVMVTDPVTLRPDDTIARCVEFVYHHKQEDFPVEVEGRLVGVLARKDWLGALHGQGADARVADVMVRHFVSVLAKTPLVRLYRDMSALRQSVFPVVENGRLVGLVTPDDISRYLIVQEARRGSPQARTGAAAPGRASRLTVDLG